MEKTKQENKTESAMTSEVSFQEDAALAAPNLAGLSQEELLRLAMIGLQQEDEIKAKQLSKQNRLQKKHTMKKFDRNGKMLGEEMPMPKDTAAQGKILWRGQDAKEGVMRNEGIKPGEPNGFLELVQRYPQVQAFGTVDDMPRGFVQRLLEGQAPLEAWEAYLKELRELEQIFAKQMYGTKKKAAPSMKTGGEQINDGFVRSLFGM